METGTKISIGGHVIMLGLAAFGGPLFDSDESRTIQVSEVSLISSAEFDSIISNAPGTPDVAQPAPIQPIVEPETAQAPAAESPPVEQTAPPVVETPPPPAEEAPDVAALSPPTRPEVVVESPEIAEQQQEATGSAVVVPDAQIRPEEPQNGQVDPARLASLRPKPRPAPRVDTQVAPKPETDAKPSRETETVAKPEETADKSEEPKEETAPAESTTEIVTEAEQDPNSAAPIKSSRPKGRPADLAQRAKAAEEQAKKLAEAKAAQEQADKEAAAKAADAKAAADTKAAADAKAAEEKADADAKAAEAKAAADAKAAEAKAAADAKAAKEAEARAIEAALKAATAEASNGGALQSGPPLTGAEKDALILAVKQCWNVPIGIQDAADLVVTLSVEFAPDGKVIGSPKLIDPAGTPQGAVRQAYEAGRRALMRCAPYSLPREKYEQWRQTEVVFNPQNMVIK